MPKNLKFHEDDLSQKRFDDTMRLILRHTPSKKPKQVAKADPKAVGKNLDRP